jgi:hypothetical protein
MAEQTITPPEQLKQLAQSLLGNQAAVRDYLQKCINCGQPAQGHMDAHNEQCEFCQLFLQNFFPNG